MRQPNITAVTAVVALFSALPGGRGADDMTLRVSGSDALYGWLEQAALENSRLRTGTILKLEKSRADGWIQPLMAGNADAALVPRPVSENELALALVAKKPELRSYPVALGAIVVIVHRDNPIESLSIDQVGALLSQGVVTWQQLDVKTKGTPLAMPQSLRHDGGEGHQDETPSPIAVFAPSASWGADEWLRRRTLGLAEISPHLPRVDTQAEMVQLVAENVRAIGFVGLPVPEGVKAISIRDVQGRTAVAPNVDNMRKQAYPLAYHVYVVTSGAPADPVREFITFLVSVEGQHTLTPVTGLLPLPVLDAHAGITVQD